MGPEELCLFSQRTNDDLNWRTKEVFVCFFVLRFYGPVNTVKLMSSWSVNLATLFLGRRPKRLTSIKFPYLRQYLTTVLHVFVSAVWRAWRRNYFMAKSQKEVCMQNCSYKHDNYSKYTYNVHVWLYSITYNFDLYLMVSQSLRVYIPIIWMMKTEGNLNPEGMSQSKIATLFFTKAKVEMSHDTTKPTKWLCAQSDQSSLCAHRYLRIQGLFLFFSCGQRRLWSDWAHAQADLSLRWALTHFVGLVMSRLNTSVSLKADPNYYTAKFMDRHLGFDWKYEPCNVDG